MTSDRTHSVALRASEHFDSLFPDAASAIADPANVANVEMGLDDSGSAKLFRSKRRYSDVPDKKAAGVTYTPPDMADFVADQMIEFADLAVDGPLRILDPAVGHGELLHSLLARLPKVLDIQVFGFETDPEAAAVAKERLSLAHQNIAVTITVGSFLDHVLDDFGDSLFGHSQPYDLIIANPPYVRTQIIGADQAQSLASQFGMSGRVDLYFAFLLGMARVLAPKGTAGIIASNRFMTTRAGGPIREALIRNLRLRSIFDLGDTRIFDTAVLPAVLIANGKGATASNEQPCFATIYEAKSEVFTHHAAMPLDALAHEGVVRLADGRTFEVRHGVLHADDRADGVWRLESDDVSQWLATVEAHSWAKFRDVGKVRVGVKTCADKIFIRSAWPEPLELLRPLTTHRIAGRFRADMSKCPMQILYPHEAVEGRRKVVAIEKFPASHAYLKSHRTALEGRTYVTEAGRLWYEIWVPQNPDDWAGPKLVFRDICEQPTFWIDMDDTVVNGDCYWLKPKPGQENVLWLALAVANSTFIEKFYDHRFNNKLYAGRRRFITQYVEEFPLPDPDSAIGEAMIERAKQIYSAQPDHDTTDMQAQLDGLVWESFGLSFEKI